MLFEKDDYNEKAERIKAALKEADAPAEIRKQSVCIDGDIDKALSD